MPYVVTLNVPGYLPESDPVPCESLSDAQSEAADWFSRTVDDIWGDWQWSEDEPLTPWGLSEGNTEDMLNRDRDAIRALPGDGTGVTFETDRSLGLHIAITPITDEEYAELTRD